MAIRPLQDILKAELGDLLAGEATSFLDLFAEHGVLECPFAPDGAMHQLIGKPAIAAYLKQLGAIQGSGGMELTGSYVTPARDWHVLEYRGLVENRRDGTSYAEQYLAVVRTEDGRITLFREYWNPVPVVASFGPDGPLPLGEVA